MIRVNLRGCGKPSLSFSTPGNSHSQSNDAGGTGATSDCPARGSSSRLARLLLPAAVLAGGNLLWEYVLYAFFLTNAGASVAVSPIGLLADFGLLFVAATGATAAGLYLGRRWSASSREWRGVAAIAGIIAIAFALALVPTLVARDYVQQQIARSWPLLERGPSVAEDSVLCSLATLRRLAGASEGRSAAWRTLAQGLNQALLAQVIVLPLLLLIVPLTLRRDLLVVPARRALSRLRAAGPRLRLTSVGAALGLVAILLGGRAQTTSGALEVVDACSLGAPQRVYNISAIPVTMTLNRFGDNDPSAFMYVLDQNISAVRAQEAAPLPDRVSIGLREDPIQPLVIRVNVGECLVLNFTNRLAAGSASLHIDGLPYSAQDAGGAVGFNPNTSVAPGQAITYHASVPSDPRSERAYFVHDHGDSRQRTVHGLFGAIVVEPAGSQHLDPETGAPLTGSNWEAIIADPSGPDFREFILIFHEIGDEEFTGIRSGAGGTLPQVDDIAGVYRPGSRAINYRSEPFRDRLALHLDKSQAYGSYMFGDPATPVPRSYLGEPTKTRILHAGSEIFHVHHLHGGGDRWRRDPESEPQDFATAPPLQKKPLARAASVRLDSQAMGPGESFNLEHECGAGGCQQAAGDFLFHCHVGHHYVGGMWGFWRVFDTLQPDLATIPERTPVPQAVPSTALLGMQIEGKTLVRRAQLTDPATQRAIEDWVEGQLPPQGTRLDQEDATVWDWARQDSPQGPLYLGEPEDGATWANFRSASPGQRFPILFNPSNGRYAWPLFRPHLGKRPPFAPNGHSGAPWLGEAGTALRPDGLCPGQDVVSNPLQASRNYPISAIAVPIQVTRTDTDANGMIFVLNEDKAAVRAGAKPRQPLAIRSNVGDCVNIIFTNEIQDGPFNANHSKSNMHTHFVQFDPQASDGVISGFSYEQSVRPYATEGRTLSADAPPGAQTVQVNHVNRLRTGIFIGVGLGEGVCGTDASGQPLPCTEVRRITDITGTTITLDRPLINRHSAGEAAGVEFVRYAWFSDVDSGSIFWHDHVNFKTWDHGLFATHVIEPPGSTYHDPVTGAAVRSGTIVDIHAPQSASVGAGQAGSFREFVYFVHRQNVGGLGPAAATVNLRAEPLSARGATGYQFSSVRFGDPFTPIPRAYLGDPFMIRGIGVGDSIGGFRTPGNRWKLSRFSGPGALSDAKSAGISERFDVLLDGGAGGPAGMAGDYLYSHSYGREVQAGGWGLLRVFDAQQADLRPLPGRTPPSSGSITQQGFTGANPLPAAGPGNPCPAGAPVRSYQVSIFNTAIRFSNSQSDSHGVMYALAQDEAAIRSGAKRAEPLVLRVNAGECLEVQLSNHLSEPAGINIGKLVSDPRGSYGAPVGFNPDSSVAAGGTRLYRYYADREIGVANFMNLANPDSAKRGAFGAVVVEPPGAFYTDPTTGRALKSGVLADILSPSVSFREYAVLLQDEDERFGQSAMPYHRNVEGTTGINYSRMPFSERNGDPALVFSSALYGAPSLLAQAFPGDGFRFRVGQAWGEQAHVFAVEGQCFGQDADLGGSELMSARQLLPGESFDAILHGGAGDGTGDTGDYLFLDHRTPFTEAGLWGVLSVRNPAPGVALLPLPVTLGCGDGRVDAPGEQCDGAADAACPGACRTDCTCGPPPVCGDNILNVQGEQCDGTADAACPGRCLPNCTCAPVPACGDGVINQPAELCDGAANAACPSGCTASCTCAPPAPRCGDGVVNQPAELCDGAASAACPNGCTASCTCAPPAPRCGDGVINQPAELCDGAASAACPNGCTPTCTCAPPAPRCGDGVINQPAELCDGAASAACPNGCTASCTCAPPAPRCGDGVVNQPAELCDGAANAACPNGCTPTCTCAAPAGGVVTASVVSDVTARAASPSTAFGTASVLDVDANSAKETYFRISVSGIGAGSVASAKLRLVVPNTAGADSPSGGLIHTMTNCAWNEATVTWNARPAIDGPVLSMLGPVALGQTVEFDITSAVHDGTFCLGADSLVADNARYASREASANKPLVIITLGAAAAPRCGDGLVNQTGELCDGAANAACPNGCTASCTCAAPAGGVVTASIVADTSVRMASPTSNFGTSSWLDVDADSAKQTFIRLTVSGLGSANPASAILRLHVGTGTGDNSASGGRIHPILNCTWGETTMTWNTRPPTDGPALATAGAVTLGQAVDFNITSTIHGDGTYCFAIDSLSSDNVRYGSRTAATGARPQVVITR